MSASRGVKDGASAETPKPERLIGTAAHVCRILDCFSLQRPTMSLSEVAADLGLRKSSVHRLLRTLLAHRYLAHDPRTRRYRLGERIGSCARVYAASATVATLARPYLNRLRARTGETASIQVRAGDRREVVAQLESEHAVRAVIDDDRDYPLDAGAAGHLLRAFSGDRRGDRDRARLAAIRKAGYAVSRGEIIDDAAAIYVPVPPPGDEPVELVLGLQIPAFRFPEDVGPLVRELRSAARDLAEVLPPGTPIR